MALQNTKLIIILLFLQYSNQSSEYNYGNYDKEIQESLRSIPPIELDFIATQIAVIKEITEKQVKYNEDAYLNISQLIKKYGFDFEEHEVLTEDGYVLGLHRIPGKGPPVLLMHGILISSDDFVTSGPDSALAYHLAREGYDVWIANARGNKYSRRHIKLAPDNPKFWDFSWHEIGMYDLPANIEYILEITKQIKLYYVGYSQGTTCFYVLCSEMPDYCEKILVHVSLSPVSFMSHSFSPVLRLLCDLNVFERLSSSGYPEFLPTSYIGSTLCTNDEFMKLFCSNVLFIAFGFNQGQLNVTNLPVIMNHMPAGCSTRQLEHYKQSIYSGKFRQYDFGARRNLKIYGSKRPPNYKVERIKVPIALFYSRSDWVSSAIDVEILRNKLPNVIDYYELKNFNHLDFMYGKDLKEKVNKRIVKLFTSLS